MTSWPLFFDDPTPFNRMRIAGLLVLATAVKFNGMAIEGTWKKQKSKDASGAVFAFQGMEPVGGEQGFSVTFRITNRTEEAQLESLWNALKPVPVAASAASPTKATSSTPTTKDVGAPPAATAENIIADLKKSLASLNSSKPAGTESTADAATATSKAAEPSPGPRPPTVPIELGWLARLGAFAGAMKKWSFDDLDVESHPDRYDVTIAFVANDPPRAAGTGAMSAARATTAGAAGTATVSASTMKSNAAGGASGT